MSTIDNPFLTHGYVGPDYFCDRESETTALIESLTNGVNVTLMSPRRYGKTGLIHHAFQRLATTHKEYACFYIDLYSTKSFADFVRALGKNIIGTLDTPLQRAEGYVTKFFRSCEITLTTDPLSSMPQFGIRLGSHSEEQTLEEIFAYIEQSGRQCVIALDEFQQIDYYEEKEMEAILRSITDRLHSTHFIFSGSKLHMMEAMFSSPKHPFYRSTEMQYLPTIHEASYYEFAKLRLQAKNIVLSADTFHHIYTQLDGVTWYIQVILNRAYRMFSSEEIMKDDIGKILRQIIDSEEENYKRWYHQLSFNQARLLVAIAKEGIAKEPTSGQFLQTIGIRSASSVQRALQRLNEDEYIYQTEDGYIVYDRFFAIWLCQLVTL